MRRQKRGNASPFESGRPRSGRRGVARRRKSPRSTPAEKITLGAVNESGLDPTARRDPTAQKRPRGTTGAGAGPRRRFLRGARRLSARAGRGTAAPSRDCHLGIVLKFDDPVASERARGPPRARAIPRRTAYSGTRETDPHTRARAAPHAPLAGAPAAPARLRAATSSCARRRDSRRRPRRACRSQDAA